MSTASAKASAKPKKARKAKAKAAPKKMGRPSLYRPEFCDFVRNAGREGFSVTATAGKLGTSRDVLYDWASKHPEFASALKAHKALRLLYWEGQLIDCEKAGRPATACIFALKNADAEEWRDRKDIHETRDETKRVTVELSERAKQHIQELKQLLFPDEPAGEANGCPPGEGNGAPNGRSGNGSVH